MPAGNRQSTRAVRSTIRRGATAIGFPLDRRSARFRAYLTRGLTVFVFHEITDQPSEFQRLSAGYTSPEAFRRQIMWIRDRFEIIEPPDLPRLGGGTLPEHAGLVTFDDAWAGVFRTGLPILASLDVPALCFVNMGTVAGVPDFAAVRRYERERVPLTSRRLERDRLNLSAASSVAAEIQARYGTDLSFKRFQGGTATPDDIRASARGDVRVWLGSHLYHHWDLEYVTDTVITESARLNAEALSEYPNSLPVLATPYGHEVRAASALFKQLRSEIVFVATGRQNRNADAAILDRLTLAPEPSTPAEWWYSTHRRRLFGHLAN